MLDVVEKNLPSDKINILIDLSIFEFWFLIQQSSLVVTNDTGTLHFAIALKKNVVSIFGPTFPDYAIGINLPLNCIVLRGITHICDRQNCRIYKSASDDRKKEIKHLCGNKHIVCTDIIPVDLVMFYTNKVLSDDMESIKHLHNLQGYNPF